MTLVGEHAGWHTRDLHALRTGEHTRCLLKVFQPIWSTIWAQMAAAQPNQGRCFSLLPPAVAQALGQRKRPLPGAEAQHGKLPKAYPSSFPDPPAWVTWLFFLPRRDRSYRQHHGLPVDTVADGTALADRDAFPSLGGHALLPAGGKAEAPSMLPQWRRHSASH